MSEKLSKPLPSQGQGSKYRQPTPEELKIHEAEKPKILKAIQGEHAKTMHKVRRMQGRVLWNDKGA